MPRPSFKKRPRETGLSSVGYPNPNTDIRISGVECGVISAPNWQTEDKKWKVRLQVEKTKDDALENCTWKWICFKARFDTEPEAREWVRRNWDKITETVTINLSD